MGADDKGMFGKPAKTGCGFGGVFQGNKKPLSMEGEGKKTICFNCVLYA